MELKDLATIERATGFSQGEMLQLGLALLFSVGIIIFFTWRGMLMV